MQVLLWLGLGIILWVGILAIQNSAAPPIAMKFLLWNFETSPIYAMLGSAGIGMFFMLLLWVPRAIRASSRAKKLRKEIEFLQAEIKHHVEETKKSPLNQEGEEIPRGLFRLLWTALRKLDADRGFFLASAITFSLLICLIPLILLLLAVLGTYLFSDQEVLIHVQRYFEGAFPSLDPRIMENIWTMIQDRKVIGLLGIVGLIWSSTWVFSSLRTALNTIFQVQNGRSLIRGKAIDFLMVFLAGFFVLLSMVLTSVITIVQSYPFPYFPDIGPIAQFALKYLIPFFLTFWIVFLIYKITPNTRVPVKPAIQGALFTSLLWEISKHLFGWYVLHLGRFSMIYGSLSTLIVFFIWIYYSSAILLFGGELTLLLGKRGKAAPPAGSQPSSDEEE